MEPGELPLGMGRQSTASLGLQSRVPPAPAWFRATHPRGSSTRFPTLVAHPVDAFRSLTRGGAMNLSGARFAAFLALGSAPASPLGTPPGPARLIADINAPPT